MKTELHGFLQRDFLLGVAITTLSFLSILMIPLIGSMVVILAPLPILYYYTKLGRIKGSAIFGFSLILALWVLRFIYANSIFPLLFFMFIGWMGIVMAEVLSRPLSIEKTVAIPLMAFLALGGALLFVHSYQMGQSPGQLIEDYISTSIRESIKIYEQMELSSEQISLLKEHAQSIAAFLKGIFPAIMLLGTCVCVWLNILAARPIFRRQGLFYPDFGDLTRWNAPEKMIWLLILSGGMMTVPVTPVKYVGLNLLIICLFIYLCEGMSIVGFFFKVKKISLFFRVFFYIMVLIQQYLLIFIIALGLFDLWADFRRFIKPAQDPAG